MNRTTKIGTGLAAGGVAVFAAATIAMASPVTTTAAFADEATPNTTTSAAADPNECTGDRHGRGGAGETLLTGDDAAAATAAAEAAVPDGTVMRVETDAEGTYEAHVITSDGTHVEVKMDADFNVTSTEERTGEMRGGHARGPRPGRRASWRPGRRRRVRPVRRRRERLILVGCLSQAD